MGIISHHIVHYGRRRRESGDGGDPKYYCLACRETFASVHRVCPHCSGSVQPL